MAKSVLEQLFKEKKVTKKEIYLELEMSKPYFDKLVKMPFGFGVSDFIKIANKLDMSARTLYSHVSDEDDSQIGTGWDKKTPSLG